MHVLLPAFLIGFTKKRGDDRSQFGDTISGKVRETRPVLILILPA